MQINNRNQQKNEQEYNKPFKYSKKMAIHHFLRNKFISITFAKNLAVLFLGGPLSGIKLVGFNNNLKLLQTLQKNDTVLSLFFIKKQNQIISVNISSIVIWKYNQNNLWEPHQMLKESYSYQNSFIMNKAEDLIISGREDGKINFWKQVNSLWSCIQTLDAEFEMRSFSLNNSSTKLILCQKSIIKVIVQEPNQQWVFTQAISVIHNFFTLTFINENQFIFQPNCQAYLEIYNYQPEAKKFIKSKTVQIDRCLQCELDINSQFIDRRKILMVTHSCQYDFFSIDQNDELILEQTIQKDHLFLTQGLLTDDGAHLVIWGQFTIEVRKLQCFK